MKKQTLSVLLSGLLTVSLTGVGFASWYIVQGDSETAGGNIAVEQVKDYRVTLDFKWDDNDGDGTWLGATTEDKKIADADDATIAFGAPEVITEGWLRNDTASIGELTFTCSATAANGTPTVTYALAIDESAEDAWDDAKEENLVKDLKLEETTTGGKISVQWGSAFGGENPFTYYNGKSVDGETGDEDYPTWGDHANYHLGRLYELLGGTNASNMKFTLTVTATNEPTTSSTSSSSSSTESNS